MRTWVLVAMLGSGGLLAGACTDSAPTQPSSPQLNLNGVWAGDLLIQGVPARMTWTLTQAGDAVTGPVLVALPTGTVLLNGTLNGTLTGTSVAYTITVSPGGIPSQPACTGQLGGSAAVSGTSTLALSGTYSVVSSTCPIPFSSGSFTLTR